MEVIFNLYKVKFNTLNDIIGNTCPLNRDDRVNVFINVEQVLRRLMVSNTNKYISVSRTYMEEFCSNIINLAAHYRLFFSKNKVYSRVYLYVPSIASLYDNRSFIRDYRKTLSHKLTKSKEYQYIGNMISDAYDIIQSICNYIDGVYFIQSGQLEASCIPYMVNEENGDNFRNFIISNDPYDFQYCNYGFDVIRPKQDSSYIVNKDNLIDIIKMENKASIDIDCDTELYPFIYSILGDKRRDIPKIAKMGVTTILTLIDRAIKEDLISKNTSSIMMLLGIIKEEHRHTILNNYYCVDIYSQCTRNLNINSRFKICSQLVDKYDNNSLRRLNDELFTMFPIQLVELCSGVDLKEQHHANRSRKNVFERK